MNLTRQVRALALPAIAHSLLQTLVFVVDRIMLGHHDARSLAAMQLAGPIEWSVISVFLAFEIGTIARVGRLIGERDRAGARRTAIVSLAYAAVAGLLVAALSPLVLRALPFAAPGASLAVRAEASGYLRITLGASPLVYLAAMMTATLQAGGDTRTPLYIGIFSNVIHVGMNRLLILGGLGVPALGMRGCGISTATTFGIEVALALVALSRKDQPVTLRRIAPEHRSSRADFVLHASRIGSVGWPSLVERILYHAGFLGYVAIIGRLGDTVMAANQALISVESICFLSADGFGIAAASLVAQKLGSGEPREARRAARIAARDAAFALSTIGILVLAGRSLILPLFANAPQVVHAGMSAVWVLALAQPFMGLAIVLGQAMRGAGRTRTALAISLVGAVFVRLFATWLFAIVLGLGLPGVWLGSTCDWIVRAGLLVWATRQID